MVILQLFAVQGDQGMIRGTVRDLILIRKLLVAHVMLIHGAKEASVHKLSRLRIGDRDIPRICHGAPVGEKQTAQSASLLGLFIVMLQDICQAALPIGSFEQNHFPGTFPEDLEASVLSLGNLQQI